MYRASLYYPNAEWDIQTPPLCSARCMRVAQCAIDGEPYCIDCGDLVLDRFVAISLNPALRESLPPLWES